QLTGNVAVGDRVVVNTTAVELGLGTGGWHVVHWNLEREQWAERGPGHIIKGRYTSLQADVGSAEEHLEELAQVESIEGMPVVAAALHSQLPAAAVAFKERAPDARLAYVMTDGAGLPLALSDLAFELRNRALIDATITCGHAFGGDYEAVSIFSALAVARHVAGADAVVVAMGPGIVGTNTRLGFSGMEVGGILDAAVALDGQPIACLRASFADPPARPGCWPLSARDCDGPAGAAHQPRRHAPRHTPPAHARGDRGARPRVSRRQALVPAPVRAGQGHTAGDRHPGPSRVGRRSRPR